MSAMTAPPLQPVAEPVTPVFGLAFASRGMSAELRRVLPATTAEALDAIIRQMQVTVFEPLVYASTPDELRERFVGSFPSYSMQYLSASLQLAIAVAQQPNTVATAITRGLREWQAPPAATSVLGKEVAMMLTSAVDVTARVVQRSLRTLMQGPRPGGQAQESRWLNGFMLFTMAVTPVLDALRETPVTARRENLVLLTMWARIYAAQLYAQSRLLGWIPAATEIIGAERSPLATATEDEERLLAEAGLTAWAEDLRAQEQDGRANPR